jgi:O-antigen/teichoic acid export membrane protein
MLGKLFRGAGLLALVYVAGEIATLSRTVIFAQWLTPAQMGALILMMTSLRLVEMVTDVSIERLVLQAPEGASRRFQALAQGACVTRGVVGALALLIASIPLSTGFGLNPTAIALLAAVPLLRGFMHLDARIYNRHLRPAPVALIEGTGSLTGLLAAAPAVMLTQGPEAAALASLAQTAAMVILSHLIARRPYRLALTWPSLKRFWNFGWPLALNALLLYAVFQGERIAVGTVLGLETLGRFGIASQLALIPALLAGRVALSAVLPQAARSAERARGSFGLGFLYAASALGVIFTATFAITMPGFIAFVFGSAYVLSGASLGWLGAAAGLRMARVGPVTLLLALGDTRGVLAGSLLRASALGAGTIAALMGHGLETFAALAAAGEGASLLATLIRLRKRAQMPRATDPGLLLLALGMGLLAFLLPSLTLNAGLALSLATLGAGLAFLKRPRWLSHPNPMPVR